MKPVNFTIPYPCEALVDQGRRIGNDPVGFGCSRPSAFSYSRVRGSNVLLCEECAETLKSEPNRLSLIFRTDSQREAAVASIMNQIK